MSGKPFDVLCEYCQLVGKRNLYDLKVKLSSAFGRSNSDVLTNSSET